MQHKWVPAATSTICQHTLRYIACFLQGNSSSIHFRLTGYLIKLNVHGKTKYCPRKIRQEALNCIPWKEKLLHQTTSKVRVFLFNLKRISFFEIVRYKSPRLYSLYKIYKLNVPNSQLSIWSSHQSTSFSDI